jgi:hypothetical protein
LCHGSLSVLSSIAETEKSVVGAGRKSCFFGQKFPGEKESETVRGSEARASSFLAKVRGEVFAHFQAVAVKRLQVVCGTDCLACQAELFVNNPLNAKENNEHALDFALQLSRHFRSR